MRSGTSIFAGGTLGLSVVAVLLALTASGIVGPLSLHRPSRTPTALTNERWSTPVDPTIRPVDVVRVLDGDTFEARVRLSPNMPITTRVRLRDVDAAELKARCAREYFKAVAARAGLQRLLAEGGVRIFNISPDKYPGRVDASVSTRRTPDVSAALLQAGLARPYDGGHRDGWCGRDG
jgi:endonuclease YncB( thermonuclease family)